MPPTIKAALWMGGALIAFSATAVAVRELSDTMGAFEIVFLRSLVGLCFVLLLAARSGVAAIRTVRPRLQAFRNVLHFGGQAGWVYGIGLLPLAEVFAIEFTVPVWATILAVLFLRERLNHGRIVAVVLGFTGILIILRPGSADVSAAALVVLAAALCYAGAHTTTKALTRRDSPLAILFWMTLMQLPMALLPALLDWTGPVFADLPWIILVGFTGLASHYCMARAFLHADATVVLPMDFLRLPLIAVVGFAFYAEPFVVWTLLGAAMIFAGNYYAIQVERGRLIRMAD